MNGVSSGDTVFVRCVCVSVCVCVCVSVCLCAADRSVRPDWALNGNGCKTVKATDFEFDMHVSRDSPDMTI